MQLPKIAFPPDFQSIISSCHHGTVTIIQSISAALDDFLCLFCNTYIVSANVDCRLYARRSPRETTSPPAAFVTGPISNVTVSCELRCRNHTESSDLSCHFLRSFRTDVRFSPLTFSFLADKQQDTALLCCLCLALGFKLPKKCFAIMPYDKM